MPESPYRGIQPFRYIDRDLFFGRDSSIQELYAKIVLYRMTILFGDSGAGKSSLLNAGLIPALTKDKYRVERIRVRPVGTQPVLIERIPEGQDPGGPFLPSVFSPEAEGAQRAAAGFDTLSLQEFRSILMTEARELPIVLVFDQFEEIFTLFEQKDVEPSVDTKSLQEEVFDTILQIAGRVDLKAKLLLVIREDFLGKLEIFVKHYPQVLDYRVRLDYLGAEQAHEAISKPFHTGPRGENIFPSQIIPELAALILDELLAGSKTVPPTQVQIVCSRLWESYANTKPHIGPDEYRTLGGLKGILEGFFGSELSHVDERLRSTATTILGSLITSSSTRDVVSREKIRQLASLRGATKEDVSATLDVLEERRLVAKTFQRGTYYYEVASEYLIPAIQREAQQLAVDLERAEAERRAAAEAEERQQELEQAQALAQAERLRAEIQQQRAEAEARAAIAEKARADEQTKAARRLKWMVLALTVVFVVAIVLLFISIRATKLAQREQKERIRLARVGLAHTLSARVMKGVYDRDTSVVLAAYAVSETYGEKEEATKEANQALSYALGLPPVRDLTPIRESNGISRPNEPQPTSLAFTPQGDLLAAGEKNGSVRIWNLQSLQELPVITHAHSKAVTSLAFSPDGRLLATGSADWTAKLWLVAESREVLSVPMRHPANVMSIAFSPSGHYLATGSWDRRVRLWNLDSGTATLEKTFEHKGPVMGVTFANDDLLASVSLDETVRLWKPSQGTSPIQSHQFKAAHGFAQLYAVAFTSVGSRLAVVGDDRIPHVVSVTDGGSSWEEVARFGKQKGLIRAVSFSPEGSRLATAGFDKVAKIWNVSNGQEVLTLTGHTGIVERVVFTDSRHAVTASDDYSVKLWELAQGVEAFSKVSVAEGHPIAGISFSSDGKLLVTASKDKGTRVYDSETTELASEFPPLRAQAPLRGISVNTDLVVAGGEDGNAYSWSIRGDHRRRSWNVGTKAVTSVAISPNRPWVLAASEDKGLSLWDMSAPSDKGKPPKKWSRTLDSVANAVAFSSDGRFLATAQQDWSAKIWEMFDGEIGPSKPFCTLVGHTDQVTSIAFSPVGNTLATGSIDGTVKIWTLAKSGCAERFTITEHKDSINKVAFSNDGRLLATASADGTLKVWDVSSGDKTLDFTVVDCGSSSSTNKCEVSDVAFSPDGKRMAASGKDGTWRIYWLDTADLLEIASRRVGGRILNKDECAAYLQTECPASPWLIVNKSGHQERK
jgi:WD40 repeat protein/DNA-binding transcriptional regulator GbsR (MarR family)